MKRLKVSLLYHTSAAGAENPADLDYELTHGFAGRLIRRKAQQLVGRSQFTAADRADIEQDLQMLVWRRRRSFDPARGHWNAFVTTVVERGIATLLEARRRQKREHAQRIVSLNIHVRGEDDEQVELSRQIAAEHKSALTGRRPRSDQECVQAAHDVGAVLAALPPDLRELAELLKTQTFSEITRNLHVSRSTLMDKVYRLRTIFAGHDLKDSVRNLPTTGAQTR